MDAKALLQQVAETYAALESLAIELISVEEDGDEEFSNRTERRAKALFVAPDKIRVDQGGRDGRLTVTNGVEVQHYLSSRKSYSKYPVPEGRMALGSFRPEMPFIGDQTFLFDHIAQSVAEAEILREELIGDNGAECVCKVLSVKYETPPGPVSRMIARVSPLVFWVDSVTHLIRRVTAEIAIRRPAEDELFTQRLSRSFMNFAINQPIPPQMFEFVPPTDAMPDTGGIVQAWAGSGTGGLSKDKKEWVERSEATSWIGDTCVQRSKLRVRGVDLTFERRITFSENPEGIRISERVSSPEGVLEHVFAVPTA